MTLTHDDTVEVDADLPVADLAGAPEEDGEREATTSVALFEGDEGRLDQAQRKALVALLKHRFVTSRTHPQEWRTLARNPLLIRSRLNDLFLDLHVDDEREVAFKRQAVPDGGGRFPTLLFDTAWSREETILMVFLRSRSRAEEATGATRVYVDRQELLDHVAALRPPHATDQAGDGRRAANAVDSLNKAGLLVGPRGGDRFEISPAIDVVLPLERLQELLRWLQEQNDPGQGEPVQEALDGDAPVDGPVAPADATADMTADSTVDSPSDATAGSVEETQ